MKKLCVVVAIVAMLAVSASAQVELSGLQQGVFRLAGAGWVNNTIGKISGMPLQWRVESDYMLTAKEWVKAEAGVSFSFVYPEEVYDNFVSRFDAASGRYGNLAVAAGNEAPTGCVAGVGTVTCNEHATKTLTLFSTNTATFEDTEKVAVEGVFSDVAAGQYVVGYTGNEFCTVFLTVAE